jgi:hypothetical protein
LGAASADYDAAGTLHSFLIGCGLLLAIDEHFDVPGCLGAGTIENH